MLINEALSCRHEDIVYAMSRAITNKENELGIKLYPKKCVVNSYYDITKDLTIIDIRVYVSEREDLATNDHMYHYTLSVC